jgi:magnesium transporter
MIKYYYKSLRTQTVQEQTEAKRGAWIYVEAPSHKELESLAAIYKLELGHLEDALDEDEMPRLEKEGEDSYIFVRFAYRTIDNIVETAPMLFIFTGTVLITVSLVRPPFLDRFLSGKVEVATTQRAKLLLQALHQIVDQYDSFITTSSKQIKMIRARLRGHEIRNQDFIDFVTIEDELNEFHSALQPTNATLRRLMVGRHVPLFDEDQDIIEDLLLNNEQSIEACSSNLKSIANIRDAYSSISSNNLNRTIKILTVATVLLTIPNVYTSLYGMNIVLPFQHGTYAFEGLLACILATILAAMWWARKHKIL